MTLKYRIQDMKEHKFELFLVKFRYKYTYFCEFNNSEFTVDSINFNKF